MNSKSKSRPKIRANRSGQFNLLPPAQKAYGGELLKTRKGRASGRPLATRNSMHLVMRSSKATGPHSFLRPKNKANIKVIVHRFARKYGVKIFSLANVGNHLHIHMQLSNRHGYRPFIRAISASIAMAVTGASRWAPLKKSAKDRFWDYRPFTRIVIGFKAMLRLSDYIRINQLEGIGFKRAKAVYLVKKSWAGQLRSVNSS